MCAKGCGTVNLKFRINGKTINHRLQNVLHAPSASNCLLSVSCLDQADGQVEFGEDACTLINKTGQKIGVGRKVNRLYFLDACAELRNKDRAHVVMSDLYSWDEWHRNFGHVGMTGLQNLHAQGLITGFNVDETSIPSYSYDTCMQAKLTRKDPT